MPPSLKVEALGALLLLLPGFMSSLFVQQISVRAKQSDFEKIVEALFFSSLLYLAIGPFFGNQLPVAWVPAQSGTYSTYTFKLQWLYLAVLGAGAIAIALLYGISVNHDFAHKLFRKLKITQKTSRISVWNDTLQDIQTTYLLIELGDGRKVLGYLRYYSDEVEQASVSLRTQRGLVKTARRPRSTVQASC